VDYWSLTRTKEDELQNLMDQISSSANKIRADLKGDTLASTRGALSYVGVVIEKQNKDLELDLDGQINVSTYVSDCCTSKCPPARRIPFADLRLTDEPANT